MKILYLNFDRGIPVLGDKGASVHVREFVQTAADLGHEVVLACATLGGGNAAPAAKIFEFPVVSPRPTEAHGGVLAPEGAGEHVAELTRELARLEHNRSVGERVLAMLARHDFQPDFVYERHALFSTAGIGIAARLGCRRILEVNAPLVEEQKRFRTLRLEGLARQMEADSFAAAHAVIAVSERVRTYVEARAPRAVAVHVMPNGVDLRRFAAGGACRERLRRTIGVDPDTCVIGFVGSFKPWHGTDFLLDVYRELAVKRPVHLLGVGDGPQLSGLRDRAASFGNGTVTLVGRVPHVQIPEWTAAIDIVVAPYRAASDFYFSPLKVVEALACGRPVVAPRIGQLPELIKDGGTGLLYEPDDPQDCRRALTRLIEDRDLRTALGRNARASVAGRGWDGIVSRVVELAGVTAIARAS